MKCLAQAWLGKQRENARKQAKCQQALSLFNDNKLGIREIQRITGLPYGTLYRKLKNPFKIEQPRGYPAYLSTSEIESVADKLKSAEHKQNGVTMPVLKTTVVDLLAGKNHKQGATPVRHDFSSFNTRKVSERPSRITLTSLLLQQIAHRVHVLHHSLWNISDRFLTR